ncbi:MAG: OsmC family protein [Gemmatimonadota bacterium]
MSDPADGTAESGPTRVAIRLEGGGECVARHGSSDTRMRTSKSPAYGGSGGSFSSTDLLAVALGTCIATDLELVAERHGIAPAEIAIDVDKTLSLRPKRIEAFRVVVRVPERVEDDVVLRLERAAGHCLVHRSLAAEIRVDVEVHRAAGGDVDDG